MENTAIIRQLRSKTRPSARCRRGSAKPVKERTERIGGNGFLNHQFKPFWAYNGDRNGVEREFFNSLSNLCGYFDLALPDVSAYAFPQNIYKSWEMANGQIKKAHKNLDCIIGQDAQHNSTLATVSCMDTGTTLYFIPVRPYWRWAQCSQQQTIAELVLVIFAYLHQVVKIPFYTEDDSCLNGHYEMIEQWINDTYGEEDNEQEYQDEQLDDLYTLRNAGTHIYRQLIHPHWLAQMETVILNYRHTDKWELEWELLALEFLQLYRQYPNTSVFDNIHPDLFHPEEEERIGAEEYISFYWSGRDSIIDTLDEVINNRFQEMTVMDEPVALQKFDHIPTEKNTGFDFETRLFDLIKRLSQLLNDYDNEEREQGV
ncbi:hypothetical protein [Mucilaginibacter sp. L196]|uniref:hypothetical protein n=1 Tax=Mucilaginibacter sp. L196 TaxID=1641870 RepID=UPI00131E7B00|nr:hypothetical protein [Mucilaginibacter sp. L196]